MQFSEHSIFTIGHSNHSEAHFINLLLTYGIQHLVDVRSVPRSRYNPHFNDAAFAVSLPTHAIQYTSMKALGGKRQAQADSTNTGFDEGGFRGYADYMQSAAFNSALEQLVQYSKVMRTAIMCAEANPGHCHRSLIADALTGQGLDVVEILKQDKWRMHTMTPFTVVMKGRVSYPSQQTLLL